jgi:hypothetical protein
MLAPGRAGADPGVGCEPSRRRLPGFRLPCFLAPVSEFSYLNLGYLQRSALI